MTRQVIAPPEWSWAGRTTYSQAVTVGDLVYTSGIAPFDDDGTVVGVGDIEAQARQTVANLARVLQVAGSGLDRVIRQEVFVRRPEDVEVFKRVRCNLYEAPYPASILVVVAGHADPDMLIEIACVASVGAQR